MKELERDEFKPWLMPNETVEALEIMAETAECIRNVAKFASLRKELRQTLINAASRLEEFVKANRKQIVDGSLLLGVDEMARARKIAPIQEIMAALENHLTDYNLKPKRRRK